MKRLCTGAACYQVLNVGVDAPRIAITNVMDHPVFLPLRMLESVFLQTMGYAMSSGKRMAEDESERREDHPVWV